MNLKRLGVMDRAKALWNGMFGEHYHKEYTFIGSVNARGYQRTSGYHNWVNRRAEQGAIRAAV